MCHSSVLSNSPTRFQSLGVPMLLMQMWEKQLQGQSQDRHSNKCLISSWIVKQNHHRGRSGVAAQGREWRKCQLLKMCKCAFCVSEDKFMALCVKASRQIRVCVFTWCQLFCINAYMSWHKWYYLQNKVSFRSTGTERWIWKCLSTNNLSSHAEDQADTVNSSSHWKH